MTDFSDILLSVLKQGDLLIASELVYSLTDTSFKIKFSSTASNALQTVIMFSQERQWR